jgi:hypothetical protein
MALILSMWEPGGLGSPTNGPDTMLKSCAAAEDSVSETTTAHRMIRRREVRPGTRMDVSFTDT